MLQRRSEQALVNQVITYLNLYGHYVWRQNTGAMTTEGGRFVRFGHKGIADVIGVLKDGRFIAVECKVGKNKPTQFQKDFLEDITKRGGVGIVAYDLDDVVNALSMLDNHI